MNTIANKKLGTGLIVLISCLLLNLTMGFIEWESENAIKAFYAFESLMCLVQCCAILYIAYNPTIKSNIIVKIVGTLLSLDMLIGSINYILYISDQSGIITFYDTSYIIYKIIYLLCFAIFVWGVRTWISIKIAFSFYLVTRIIQFIAWLDFYASDFDYEGYDAYLSTLKTTNIIAIVVYAIALILIAIYMVNQKSRPAVAEQQFIPTVPASNPQEPQHKIITKIPHKKI